MSKHVLIVGSGVIGLCTAYYCVQRGFRVTVLESQPANGDNCSLGNAGLVVPSHITPLTAPGNIAQGLRWLSDPSGPFYIHPRPRWGLLVWLVKLLKSANRAHVARAAPLLRDLQYASRSCYEEFDNNGIGDFGFTKNGLLEICRTGAQLSEYRQMAEQLRDFDVPAELLTPDEAAAREPNIDMDICGALSFPDDCHITPAAFVRALTEKLHRAGAKLVYSTPVTGWRFDGANIFAARTNGEDFTADEYVVCGGAWSQAIVRDLGVRLPLQSGKGYSLTLTSPPQLPKTSLLLGEARVAVTPMDGQLRFAGTVELAAPDQRINERRVQAIREAVLRYFPAFTSDDLDSIEPWSGLRPCSPDGLPYIGRVSRYRNLSIATAHAMMGVSLGPVTGKLTAEILAGEQPSIPISILSPDR
jgi:D-amino-acid dehydrogenase